MLKQKGFTLIELMIVVAILGILAAIAWPSYQEQVRSGRRADAQGALMGLAQAMERHFTENGSYEGAAAGGADIGAPAIFPAEAPLDSGNKTYDLWVDGDPAAYIIEARPKGAQAGDGTLRLTSSGQRSWDSSGDGSFSTSENCWEKKCN